jgi:hypothetical protein
MNQGNGHEVPLAERSRMPTAVSNLLAPWQIKLHGLLDNASSRITSLYNIHKEFFTPFIILEMLQIEQQQQQRHTNAARAA